MIFLEKRSEWATNGLAVAFLLVVALPGVGPDSAAALTGAFNVGLLSLVGLVFVQNVMSVLLETERDGLVLGQWYSSTWAPLRVVLVVAALAPVPGAGGLSGVQVLAGHAAGIGGGEMSAAASAAILWGLWGLAGAAWIVWSVRSGLTIRSAVLHLRGVRSRLSESPRWWLLVPAFLVSIWLVGGIAVTALAMFFAIPHPGTGG